MTANAMRKQHINKQELKLNQLLALTQNLGKIPIIFISIFSNK